MMAGMKLELVRWILLPVALVALVDLLVRGLAAGSAALFLISGLGWYAMSRWKVHSLDRGPGNRRGSDAYWKK